MLLRPRSSQLFPYTTLFRSHEPPFDDTWEPQIRGADGGDANATVLAHLTDAIVREGGERGDPDRPTHRRYVRVDSCAGTTRSEEHTSELQSQSNLVCRLLLE